jgi:hypothetical protein
VVLYSTSKAFKLRLLASELESANECDPRGLKLWRGAFTRDLIQGRTDSCYAVSACPKFHLRNTSELGRLGSHHRSGRLIITGTRMKTGLIKRSRRNPQKMESHHHTNVAKTQNFELNAFCR